jgi:exo-1,4-beta-D-glucosaminidase
LLNRYFAIAFLVPLAASATGGRQVLRDGWAIRSSADVHDGGAALSTVGASTAGWLPAQVPATVVAAQVAHGDFPDPGYGMNLRNIPGTSDYPIGEKFALHEMSRANPYRVAWWYRTEFDLPPGGERVWLHFDGINYRV